MKAPPCDIGRLLLDRVSDLQTLYLPSGQAKQAIENAGAIRHFVSYPAEITVHMT